MSLQKANIMLYSLIKFDKLRRISLREQENIYRVITDNLPRKTRLYPRVIRVLSHHNQYPLPKERKFSDTQICIHFSESHPPFEVCVNGKKYSADCPRIYIKRADEVHYTTCSDDNIQDG